VANKNWFVFFIKQNKTKQNKTKQWCWWFDFVWCCDQWLL